MPTRVDMPKLGQTVEEATVVRWLKKEGDAVQTADILCEVQTDKATLEVESWSSGTLLKIVAAEDEVIPVGGLIAVLGDAGEEIPAEWLDSGAAAAPKAQEAETVEVTATAEVAQTSSAPAGRIFASPRARAAAGRGLVPLAVLTGSGPNGRIIERDVLDYAGRAGAIKATPLARKLAFERGVDLLALAAGGKIDKAAVLAAEPARPTAAAGDGQVVPLSPMRQVIAERMSASRREIPCFHCGIDLDMTDAVALREAGRGAKGKAAFAFGDLILKAAALALAKMPQVNSGFGGDHVRRRGEVNVGFAVSLDEGLMVPVIRNADRKSVREIAAESAALAAKARGKHLGPDDYTGGCLTVSNLGAYGIEWFVPIINPGESAILGVSAITDKVVAVDGMVAIRKRMTLVGSFDHRVVDGAVGAAFLAEVKSLLENPEALL